MSLFRNVFRPARAAQVLGAFLLALALAAGVRALFALRPPTTP